jgi:hypothetical protein
VHLVALPFTISDVHWGMSQAAGSLRLTRDFLVLEVHVTALGLIKQKPLTLKIAPEAIHSVRYKRGAFKDRLIIRPFKAMLLSTVPGKHQGEVTLRVKRAHREEAIDLTEDIAAWLDVAPTT